ncbi:branched-chain amino acid aminotransferase [Sporomusa acidovorans]|uniref:Branched-chain-amino-acid aminotransferase n=1 Tax=Sporomusa acidovorans (strain ATCC 49682 / DSM 3132 / Mol) TaxID=1123286 RepID=A0ABZ3IXB9_SPOA4|nr:branched-chain amino acid aminotransferase [Sporomusa acidovorans]OZC13961.1 branched-chain-amino-acid aminotransferase 2 [Sporomusa acidovorans DSM 3132]SDF39657.1 branched-chain amino acid aminotransferase [Sporomusa acidovorans]
MTDIAVTLADKRGTLPAEDKLGFGKIFTDHMFAMDYVEGKGWHNARIVPYGDYDISPAAMVLHYGQAIFEGMKAFRTEDNRIVMYRPMDHLKRFNNSADILTIPRMDIDVVHAGLRQLVELEKHWVPKALGTSLYIRPFVISIDPYVGVKVAEQYTLFIILSPVGAYYASGFKPVKIKVEEHFARAVKGGLGEAKTPANYAASLKASEVAKEEGYTQVLWLDAIEKKYIEEVGTMNIFFKINDEIITPELDGSILNGITRRSVLQVAKSWGMKATERRISIAEVYEAHAKGQLQEVFGSGTAAVISPVGELSWKGKKITINNNQIGETSQKLFDYITGLQQGRVADKFGWVEEVAKL